MVDVQQYDVFYDEFRKIISEIEEQKEKEDQLLVNMASGTPGMKAHCLLWQRWRNTDFANTGVYSTEEK